ncbi:putative ATP/GTP-binding protein [Pseudonocardia sp. Ae706_Ps2]|nr:putative ATP/GTP-binding protein [Pseudonocardia sp. Ae505_Ps2]OLM21643.1 putative ATP/GTP-binding protein [Pseudonocardia sp. Ae706_Ps2]
MGRSSDHGSFAEYGGVGLFMTERRVTVRHRGAGRSTTTVPLREDLRARHDSAATDVRTAGRRGDMPALLDATRRAHQVLTAARRDLGPDDPDTLVAEGTLAVALLLGYDRTGGLELATRNLAAREALLGPDHPASLAAADAVAAAHRETGDAQEAVRRHEDVVTRRTRVLGETHPCTIASRAAVAIARADTGDLRGAAGLLAATLEVAERALGDGHAVTDDVRELLADCRAADAAERAAEPTGEPDPPTGVLPRMRRPPEDAEPPTEVLPRTPDPREDTLPIVFDRPSGPLRVVR